MTFGDLSVIRRALVLAPLLLLWRVGTAEEPKVAFLLPQASSEKLEPEAKAALALAEKLVAAKTVRASGNGGFADLQGQAIELNTFALAWVHQGDSTEQSGPIYDPATLEALRKHVESGHGLYLSGAAFAMVHLLRIEPVNPRLGGPGNDTNAAGLVPLEKDHPIFEGLKFAGEVVPISDRGYPAFSDFHASGGPSKGMLLARTPGGSENPLAEYELGKGRIIVMGWRLPHYSYQANPHRPNLERLTANILGYLSKPDTWRKVVVRAYPGQPPPVEGQAYVEPPVSQESVKSLKLAIQDLINSFGKSYPNGSAYLNRLEAIRKAHEEKEAAATKEQAEALEKEFQALRRESLLSNPLIDFERILTVKRSENSPRLGLVQNWEGNSSLPTTGYDNEIAVLSEIRGEASISTLFKPEGGRFVGDVDLHWDGSRMLCSMPGRNGRWQVHELNADGSDLRELPLILEPDVDNYDACYLPSGNVLFTSTAPFTGVPCVTGASHVSNIYLLEQSGRIRRLTSEQDHDWCPTVLPNGRVLYLRWEYSDIPHFVSRILFHMNPDGTEQMEYYGSNSYWPNAVFFARPCPGSAGKFVGIVGGHHDVPRMGELVLFDVAKGRHEAAGAVQRIPGYGRKVEPVIRDGLVGGSWPKFLHPWPLSDKHFIVSAKPSGSSRWGIYLADVFDNMLLLKEEPYYALLEPIPFRKTTSPPIIPDKARPEQKDALVLLPDVYAGDGLKDVPRGTVKKLRLFTYHFAYYGMGGQVNRVGLDGPWDIKRVIGTVPVEPDGSASFRIPANTPISIQPLDAEGKALQLMRSWMTAMPGEVISCAGCHEPQNRATPSRSAMALGKPPVEITPWYGPTRGFSFKREVQPVLDHDCVGCHSANPRDDGKTVPDFTARPEVHPQAKDGGYNNGTKFSPSYIELRSYVRSHTIESDIHLLEPCEFHADTTRLVQLLKKGHYGVELGSEAWDRLITWIDLNTPYHGTWHEIVGMDRVQGLRDRRQAMEKLYAGRDENPEEIHPVTYQPPPANPNASTSPPAAKQAVQIPKISDWPFDEVEAKRRQESLGPVSRTIKLAEGMSLELVRIPVGEFILGAENGCADELPLTPLKIERPFWMGKFEVTNEQFECFDPTHDSRIEHGDFLHFSEQERGYPVNAPKQPVCRVNWNQAMAFCGWLTEKTGEKFSLPTEAEWEYACRAGTATPLWYGESDADFAASANLADHSLRFVDTFGWGLPSGAVPPWRPAIETVNDKHRVSAPVGSFKPNAWGLCDMAGNVWEWTLSSHKPYPYQATDGRNDGSAAGHKVVRGGSWYDRPKHARSSCRLSYPPWQRVYDVGFRVVCEVLPAQPNQ